MTEAELQLVNGLVARFYAWKKQGVSDAGLFDVQRRLLTLGIKLDEPVEAPDPHAPQGGSTIAMRKAA